MSDLIKREDAIQKKLTMNANNKRYYSEEYIKGWEDGVRDQYNATMPTNDNWIPVKKHGTPHNEGLYIVTLRNWYGAGRCAFYDDVEILPYGREGWDKATAWMPFPEPYRESEVEE